MLRKILTGLVLASLLLTVASCAKKEPAKITIATDATWPPMEMVDTNKNIVGFDIDLMNAAAKAGGFTVEFKNTAWDGIFAGLENGKYDAVMSSVTINDERKKTMDFSIPYINAGQILVVKSEVNGVTKLDDLKGKTVGAQIGTTGAFEIDKVKAADKINEKTYDDIGLAFEDLVNGRIDAVVVRQPDRGELCPPERQVQGQAEDRRQPVHRGVLRGRGEEGQHEGPRRHQRGPQEGPGCR